MTVPDEIVGLPAWASGRSRRVVEWSLLVLLAIALTLAVLPPNAAQWLEALLVISVALALVFCVGFLSIVSERWQFPRRVTIEGDQLVIETPATTTKTKLSDCFWFVGTADRDAQLFGKLSRRCVILSLPERTTGLAVGLTPEMFNRWTEFLHLARVAQGRSQNRWDSVTVVAWGIRGLLASGFIAALPAAPILGNRVAEFARLFVICTLPIAAILYGTVRAGSCWWLFSSWQAYLFSLIWFAVPTIIAAAWVGGGPGWFAGFLFTGLILHLGVFAGLRRGSRGNVVA